METGNSRLDTRILISHSCLLWVVAKTKSYDIKDIKYKKHTIISIKKKLGIWIIKVCIYQKFIEFWCQ